MTADELIRALDLQPHPEGGWYRETWRAEASPGERAAASAVLYVIEPGQRSQWNRVDADEIWLWHAGDPVELRMARDSGPVNRAILGGRIADGEQVQLVIPAGHWQSAEPVADGQHRYSLISCIVAPAFEFKGFELAERGWEPHS